MLYGIYLNTRITSNYVTNEKNNGEKMNMKKTIEEFERLGGKRWQKSDKDRIYFSGVVLARLMGYEWGNYKTGNISSAKRNSDHVSNSQMTRILNDLEFSNLYYDIIDKEFYWKSGVSAGKYVDEPITILREIIKKIEVDAN